MFPALFILLPTVVQFIFIIGTPGLTLNPSDSVLLGPEERFLPPKYAKLAALMIATYGVRAVVFDAGNDHSVLLAILLNAAFNLQITASPSHHHGLYAGSGAQKFVFILYGAIMVISLLIDPSALRAVSIWVLCGISVLLVIRIASLRDAMGRIA